MLRAASVAMGLMLAGMAGHAAAVGDDVHRELNQALTCEGSPLDVVSHWSDTGSAGFAQGYAGYQLGEEMDTITGVVLRSPVIIAGARTHHVVGALASLYEGFGAYVHARFRGDYRQVVDELGLTRDAASGSYFRAMPVADPDDVCPLTIELKRLEDGEFLLGCGWCNG